MTREWKPGDVATVAWRHFPAVVAIFNGATRQWEDADGADFDGDEDELTIRPLVVIDPEDREQVERLLTSLLGMSFAAHACGAFTCLQAALREFADPKPTKPDEPQGLGAVVAAIYDNQFVHMGNGVWQRVGDPNNAQCDYRAIDVIEVLSEGVTS